MPKQLNSRFGLVLISLSICFLMVFCGLPLWVGQAGGGDGDGARAPQADPAPVVSDQPTLAGPSRATGGYVILTNIPKADPYYQAVTALKNYRAATVITFDPSDLDSLLPTLQASKPRYVALVMKPIDIHINFTREFLMMSTNVDPDPFSDFSYGFITGATAQDALNFVNNIIKAEQGGIQDAPLNISGYAVTSLDFSFKTNTPYDFTKELVPSSYSKMYLGENDTGSSRDFFHANKNILKGQKVLDIGNNGDAHMLWLFEGGNSATNPPIWDYDPAKIEDPAYARVGLTSSNLSGLDLYPAVAFNGACHSGEPKTVMIESDIEATFGDTKGLVEFYTMSNGFSFALNMLKTNITGYFAPCGANNANDKSEEYYNAFLYHESLGDIHKRTVDGVVMGFAGNRPNLTLFEQGDSTYQSEVLPSGTFDPTDYSAGGMIMLSGKANRIYYGDPMFDPFKYNHSDALNYTKVKYQEINDTALRVNLTTLKPDNYEPEFDDRSHHGETKIYYAIELPPKYSNVSKFEVTYNERPYTELITALEQFDGKTIMHVEVDLPDDSMHAVHYNITFQVTVPEVLATGNYDVAFLEGNQTGQVLPNATHTYTLHVKNNGSTADNITLSNNTAPAGWGLDITFNGTDIAPGENRTAVVNVTAPPNALALTKWYLNITATSEGNSSETATINITTEVLSVINFTVVFDSITNSTLPGQPCGYRANITNLGNYKITLLLNFDGLREGWNIDLPEETDINPFSGRVVTPIITPSENTSAGSYQIVISVVAKYQIRVNNTLDLIVLPVHKPLFLADSPLIGSAPPGNAAEYTLPIANLGNIKDNLTLNVTSAPANWTVEVAFNGTDVPSAWWPSNPGLNLSNLRLQDIRNATVRITPPANASGDLVGNVTLQVASASNSSAFDAIALSTTVLWVHELSVNASENMSGKSGSAVFYLFNVTNEGNGQEDIWTSFVSANGWGIYLFNETDIFPATAGSEMSLLAGASVDIWVLVAIPENAPVYFNDTLTFTVSSNSTPGLSVVSQVTTTVLPLYEVLLDSITLHKTVKEGENATFTFTVTNVGNIGFKTNLEMWGQHPEWTKLSLVTFWLAQNSTQTITLNIHTTAPGNFSFVVMAKPPQDSTSITFTLEVQPGPEVEYEDTPDTEGGRYTWCIVFILIAIGLLLLLVIYMRLRKMKAEAAKKDEEENEADDNKDEGPEDEDEDSGDEEEGTQSENEHDDGQGDRSDDGAEGGEDEDTGGEDVGPDEDSGDEEGTSDDDEDEEDEDSGDEDEDDDNEDPDDEEDNSEYDEDKDDKDGDDGLDWDDGDEEPAIKPKKKR